MKYLQPLIEKFESHADPIKAERMFLYLEEKFPMLGLDSKTREGIQKDFYNEFGYPENLFEVVFKLWELSEREYQMCAINLLRKFQNKLKKNDIQKIEKLITTKSWWDSVDGLSIWICSSYFKLFPESIVTVTTKWMKSNNIWLQRSVLLFQLKYKSETNAELLSNSIIQLKDEKEFFIRKAIGWILREYSKTNPLWVKKFLVKTKLSGLSYREASKYI